MSFNLFSTKINDLHGNNVQSHTGGQRGTSFSHINDPTGLRLTIDDRCHAVNERQNVLNGQNLVNGHHNSTNEHHSSTPNHCKISNDIAQSKIKISHNEQPKITNGLQNNKSEQPMRRSYHKQNDYPIKNHQINVNHKNGINRLANEKSKDKELQKDTFNIAVNLRQLLRPTVIEKRQESVKVEYDAEDINGPYNFRQLLRPTGYLPTESLRKRKGGLVSNGVPLPKDKVPEKHVKRRAPLAPTQNKLANGKK